MRDELGKDEHIGPDGGDDEQPDEDSKGDLRVEPTKPADDPDEDEVPRGTKPGAET
jgi:hypothetical protein